MKIKRFLPILFVPFLSGCHIVPNTYNYDNADKYVAYSEATTISNTVTELEINYVEGSVTVESGDVFKIEESETNNPCYYWNNQETNKFTVQFVQNGFNMDGKDFKNKHLTITVPVDLTTLSLNLISSKFTVSMFSNAIDNLNINTVSGSGVAIVGANKNIKVNTISGNANLSIEDTLLEESIKTESVSGDIVLALDKRRGFDVDFKSISGTLNNQFGEATETTLTKYSIKADSVSGNLTIYSIQ